MSTLAVEAKIKMQDAAKDLFTKFLTESMNHLHPDGGRRILCVEVVVEEPPPHGYADTTKVTMSELVNGKEQVLFTFTLAKD